MENFKASGIYTKQAHVKIPENHFEEEHARKGFFGKVSHLYHTRPPVEWDEIDGDLKPRALPPIFNNDLPNEQFITLLYNSDCSIEVANFSKDWDYYFRNADADELYFIHSGVGLIESIYGDIPFTKGDYINIPRGTTYTLKTNQIIKILKISSYSGEINQPDRSLLGPNALYDQTAIFVPTAKSQDSNQNKFLLKILRLNKMTTVTYSFNPLTAAGWKGSLYPYKLSIYDFCPVMSHRYHMPPSAHTTFVSNQFVVCSFVARPLEDEKEGVLKVPFYHSNIDFDEVLFYHQGNFFSRDNIDEGALTFHPQGIHHGPHPKAMKAANSKTHTDEFAVMIDTKKPLMTSEWFSKTENKNYYLSWRK